MQRELKLFALGQEMVPEAVVVGLMYSDARQVGEAERAPTRALLSQKQFVCGLVAGAAQQGQTRVVELYEQEEEERLSQARTTLCLRV